MSGGEKPTNEIFLTFIAEYMPSGATTLLHDTPMLATIICLFLQKPIKTAFQQPVMGFYHNTQ
jgi:hypothetical protein